MPKKRRIKVTVHGCVEGDTEQIFLDVLISVYRPDENDINVSLKPPSGGTPEYLVGLALRECHRDQSFAWFDEDFEPENPLEKLTLEKLAHAWNIKDPGDDFFNCPLSALQKTYNPEMRKPVLITSRPVCVESLILRCLGLTPVHGTYDPSSRKKQIKELKSQLKTAIGGNDAGDLYRKSFTKELLEERRQSIEELDLLISMITA